MNATINDPIEALRALATGTPPATIAQNIKFKPGCDRTHWIWALHAAAWAVRYDRNRKWEDAIEELAAAIPNPQDPLDLPIPPTTP